MKLIGLHFADDAAIQAGVTNELNRIQKEGFLDAFKKLYDRAKACMYVNGAYSELKKKWLCTFLMSL